MILLHFLLTTNFLSQLGEVGAPKDRLHLVFASSSPYRLYGYPYFYGRLYLPYRALTHHVSKLNQKQPTKHFFPLVLLFLSYPLNHYYRSAFNSTRCVSSIPELIEVRYIYLVGLVPFPLLFSSRIHQSTHQLLTSLSFCLKILISNSHF